MELSTLNIRSEKSKIILVVLLHTEKIHRLVLFAVDYYCAYSANGFFRETFCLDVHYI